MIKPEIEIVKARAADAKALALASKHAFDHDVHYGAPCGDGPPGYDSAEWQKRMMRQGDYYKIVVDGTVAGGIIVFRQDVRVYHLGRIYLAPEFQNRGIGARAMEFLWETYPLAKKWTLDTPEWNHRTRHFYHKMGFVEVGIDPYGDVQFERVLAAPHLQSQAGAL